MNLKYYEDYRVLDMTSFLINCQDLNWSLYTTNKLLKGRQEIPLEMKKTKFFFLDWVYYKIMKHKVWY